ncbi:MAG: hypothetical protein C4519_19415 [Desulfobacteraceae bacterium]|nr:MAG: hypothetical protein C4519_19415 [Desulfobacteraceae bacterium]
MRINPLPNVFLPACKLRLNSEPKLFTQSRRSKADSKSSRIVVSKNNNPLKTLRPGHAAPHDRSSRPRQAGADPETIVARQKDQWLVRNREGKVSPPVV